MRASTAATAIMGLLGSLALIGVLSPRARAVRPIVTSFSATVVDPPARSVRFEWTMNPERDEQMSCTIDVDVDDPGTVDATVSDCGEDTSFDYTYDEPGTYLAALTVTSSAGGSERVIVTVVLR